MLRKGPALLALALTLAGGLNAKIYYVNKGIRYHLGDTHFQNSIDANFLGAYPVVGPQWVQAFTVNTRDTVKVHIDHIWGVDDCPYCKDMVSIGDHDMGRLTAENNHVPFDTLEPLAFTVEPGHVYYLKIESYKKDGHLDNFAIEGVSVETENADVVFLQPGPVMKMPEEPMPVFHVAVAPKLPCQNEHKVDGWLPSEFKSQGFAPLGSAGLLGDEKQASMPLDKSEFMQVFVRVDQAQSSGLMGQDLELLVGDEETGWVFSFGPGQTRPNHGNLKIQGRYQAPTFKTLSWKQNQWNELRLIRCEDGLCQLWLNDQDLGQSFKVEELGPAVIHLRALGLNAKVAEAPF